MQEGLEGWLRDKTRPSRRSERTLQRALLDRISQAKP
jgi:hypothetical protein